MVDLVAGWTGGLEFRVKSDGTNQNLTGMTVALFLRDDAGTLVTFTSSTGDVEATSSTGGHVTFYPPATTTLVSSGSPYSARVRVTDGTGKVVYYPSAKADVWVVYSQ